ncbi:MAG: addiction module protein [Rhodomicrobium sp.]|jgi:putative addiction module component (TIGR02574 family)
MNERVRLLSEEAAKLTPEERLELVEVINLSLLRSDDEAADAWDREAADRFGAYDRGEMQALSWEEVKQRRASK